MNIIIDRKASNAYFALEQTEKDRLSSRFGAELYTLLILHAYTLAAGEEPAHEAHDLIHRPRDLAMRFYRSFVDRQS